MIKIKEQTTVKLFDTKAKECLGKKVVIRWMLFGLTLYKSTKIYRHPKYQETRIVKAIPDILCRVLYMILVEDIQDFRVWNPKN